MYEMLYSSLVSQLLVVAVELGLADALADGPRDVDDLAEAAGAHPGALYRAMRALASVGVFTETAPRTFGHTGLSETLRGDAESSMADLARYVALPARQRAFGAVGHSVRTGHPAFDHEHGMSWWEYFAADPAIATLFNRAMGGMARMVNSAVLESYDFGRCRHLVDVGGGQGHLVAMIAQRFPDLTAVVFDLARVVPEAEAVVAEAGIGGRVRCEGGDFLEAVPAGGDTYVVSWTLHDWDDADAVRILANIRAVLPPGGEVVVIDEVPPGGDAPHFGKFQDIVMLTLLKGRIRDAREWAPLFERAGLHLREVRATSSPTSVLVAERA
ncbi:methyltransferase [Streptomonospora alba]|uniref:Methyltransferase n=2 Tax=Streptomonospora alba TaxID=183763 RepID=A0A0C2J8A0_9ACTN|nr:methyltransferase [Streptomonospora alba]